MDPTNFSANNSLGLVYAGSETEDIEDYEKALPFNQQAFKSAQIYNKLMMKQNLAENHFFLENYENAKKLFEEIEIESPNSADIKYFLGIIYVIQEDERGTEYLKQAIEIEPSYAEYLDKLLQE